MFRIKICGVTTVADAAQIAASGADAIGLNFYPGSKRCVTSTGAEPIMRALPVDVAKVGLFVNADVEYVHALAQQLSLDLIQLHGDETPEFVAALHPWPVLKAFRAGANFSAQVTTYIAECQRLRAPLAGVLIDAFQAGAYGGTGATADWEAVAELRESLGDLPLILAGGLTADNVTEAIARVGPYGVDTASGVERSPGIKDAAKVQAFVSAARDAFAKVGQR